MSNPDGKVLLLSRQPLRSRPLQQWLGLKHSANTVLLTTAAALQGVEEEVLHSFAHIETVEHYQSWATELRAEQLARKFHVERVASTSEMDVLRAARLRERLGLPGQSVPSAIAYRDKLLMRQLLQKAGVPIPAFSALDNPSDLLSFIERANGPVVVKPRLGFASAAVSILREEWDVTEFLNTEQSSSVPFLPGQWMVEEYVSGLFHHVDGLMRDGEVLHCYPSRYSGGLAERVRQNKHLGSLMLDPVDSAAATLSALAAQTVAALPSAPEALAFHLEAWIRPDGSAIVCEIASRAGGGPIVQGYQKSFGVQLAHAGLLSQYGDQIDIPAAPTPQPYTGWLMFSGTGEVFDPPPGDCPVPGVELKLSVERGEQTAVASDSSSAVATAVLSADSHAELANRMVELERWWEN
ncbi:ATP-grasp domain-containing protein [Psychromicrobium lacuslunae]|uniref:ATP-grasp domain-containing protein n=1 Tax=Psychromicrobium lacuslunae TaxID=1618207 RepID=UPI0006984489|nr:hypothetical protein [Psychromicrobium lacuslunae]